MDKKHAQRLFQSTDWSPYSAFEDYADPQAQAKAEAANRLIHQAFTSGVGRKVLGWMIGSFCIRVAPPENQDQAMFWAGQQNVVNQILQSIEAVESANREE